MSEEIKPGETRPGVTLVTADNFEAYVADQLPAQPLVEDIAAEELAEAEKTRAANLKAEADKKKKDEPEDIDHPDEAKKSRLNERFSELTAKRKEAEAKAAAKEVESKAERERADKAEQRARELQDKYEPPKSDELGPEPLPVQFSDVAEYSKAIKDWTAEKTRHDDRKAAETERYQKEQQRIANDWNSRQKAAKERIPDYEEKLTNSAVKVSDDMRDAIVESEVGPEILVHLADNPDVAEKLGKMSVRKMLIEFGKLETSLGSAEKPQTKSEASTVAEISRAPAPITPLKNAGAPVATIMSGAEEFHGTYEQFKAKRLAGKIR